MCHADGLSRLPISDATQVESIPIYSIYETNVNQELNFSMTQKETQSDKILSKVYLYLKDGWPSQIDPDINVKIFF